ncbi:MAG: hypothetical protein ACI81L_000585 [Verrucomicrobiales bacterium]|jgi:hypothetical protein
MTRSKSRVLSIGFLILLLALGGFGYRVGRAAQTAVLESQSGSISEFTLDPTAPGFRAFTESTPTVLVLHTTVTAAGAELVGVSLLTEADGDAGGTVVTIPRTFTEPDSRNIALSTLFAEEGLDSVTAEMRASLRIGFQDVVVLDAAAWTTLMAPDLPLELTLRDDLVTIDPDGSTRVLLRAGTRPFDLAEIARMAAHRNPGEPGLAVALRQQQIWQSWISRTASSTERPDLFQLDSGFVDLIGSLANAEVSYRVIPSVTEPSNDPEAARYIAERTPIHDLIAQIVPFPEPAEPGDRPSVLLLDTTFGETSSQPFVSAIARSGGLVTILGNSEADSGMSAEVQVHESSASAIANEIADRLGLPTPTDVPLEDATASITVIIG